jgi:hypothetical protein
MFPELAGIHFPFLAIVLLFQRGRKTAESRMKAGFAREEDGERGRNRTFNLLIKSQLLCQLSYAPILLR